jgi:hypothetical protein
MSRRYNSFDEVEKDIKILDLRRQIAMEQVKGDFVSIKEHFQPPEILSYFGSGVFKKVLFSWLLGFVLRRLRR